MLTGKEQLLFISPRYLIPADSGGKIRTRDILMGLKGGLFKITLISPGREDWVFRDREELRKLCDHFLYWPEVRRGTLFSLTRLRHMLCDLPISVAADRSMVAANEIAAALAMRPDVVVIDFLHTGVVVHNFGDVPAVLLAHNVEAEIFRRHAVVARTRLMRAMWRNQTTKMARFEHREMARYNAVIAVADRDKTHFEMHYGTRNVAVIPTGVNLDLYAYEPPIGTGPRRVVFCGSMDWLANVDAIEYFMELIWPLIAARDPQVRFTVVGRNPPARLVRAARQRGFHWDFTGFVEDVRPYLRAAQVCVIPLRVGGGTRIKVYEAMAMGRPIVSTAIGVEGLPLEPGKHYELGDDPAHFAEAIIRLLNDIKRRIELAERARHHVETTCSHAKAARIFETICANVCHPNRGWTA